MAVTATRVRAEIDAQRTRDEDWGRPLDVVAARVRALAGAQRATLERADDAAPYVLRAALIDLAAACELAADGLPPPDVDRAGWRERHRALHRQGLDLGEIAARSPFTRPTITKDLGLQGGSAHAAERPRRSR